MSSLMGSGSTMHVPGLMSQWFFHAFTTVVKFGFWAGLLYCACQWVPVAWRIAAGH
jgi:hypothetical protein